MFGEWFWFGFTAPFLATGQQPCSAIVCWIAANPTGRRAGSHQFRAQAGAVAVWQPTSKQGIETFGQRAAPSVAPGWLPLIAPTKRASTLQFLKRQPPSAPRSTKTEQQFKHHISIGSCKWLFNCYSMFMGIKRDEATHLILGLPTQNSCL